MDLNPDSSLTASRPMGGSNQIILVNEASGQNRVIQVFVVIGYQGCFNNGTSPVGGTDPGRLTFQGITKFEVVRRVGIPDPGIRHELYICAIGRCRWRGGIIEHASSRKSRQESGQYEEVDHRRWHCGYGRKLRKYMALPL